MGTYEILWAEGDGSGPELRREAIKVLNAIGVAFRHKFNITPVPLGAKALDSNGKCYPDETRRLVRSGNFHGIVKEPVGLDQKGMNRLLAQGIKLENEAIIPVREDLDAYSCYRPAILPGNISFISPLRPERVGTGLDILFLRELTGGSYFGNKVEGVTKEGEILEVSSDEDKYTRPQIERIARVAFKEAQRRGVKLTDIHKKNIKATSRHWDAIVNKMGKTEFPDVKLEECLVDAFSTYLITKPTTLNGVVVLENLQGDILTDEVGGVIGSLGLIPSACWNAETRKGYFEPSHGSAPTIAGHNTVNPYAMIGSIAYMLEIALGLKVESRFVSNALTEVLANGHMTRELVVELNDRQKKARANDDYRRLHSAFTDLKAGLTEEQIKALIEKANDRCDADLESRVVSTTQFGDLVTQGILRTPDLQ